MTAGAGGNRARRRPMLGSARGGGRIGAAWLGGLVAAWLALLAPVAARAETTRIAVFPIEFVDTSQEGEENGARADETARIAMATALLASLLEESGRYTVVEMAPEAVAGVSGRILSCNGCELAVADAAGADQEAILMVQKISNLIVDMTLYVRDVESRKALVAATTSIRGNTDESWARGVRWLVDRKLLAAR